MPENSPPVTAALKFVEQNPEAFSLPANKAFFGLEDLFEAQWFNRLRHTSRGEELEFKLAYQMYKAYDTSGYQQIVQHFGNQLANGVITAQDWDKIVIRAIDACVAQASGTVIIFVDVSENPYPYPEILTACIIPGLRRNANVNKILYLTGVHADTKASPAHPRHPNTVFLEAEEPEIRSDPHSIQSQPEEPWQYIEWSTQQASADQFKSRIDQLRQEFMSQATRISPAGANSPFRQIYSIIESIDQQKRIGRMAPALAGPLNFAACTLALDLVDRLSERTTKPNAKPTLQVCSAVNLLLGKLPSIKGLSIYPTGVWTHFPTVPDDQISKLETHYSDVTRFIQRGKTRESRRLGEAGSAPAALNENKGPALPVSDPHAKTEINALKYRSLLLRLRRGYESHRKTVRRLEDPLAALPDKGLTPGQLDGFIEQLRVENSMFHQATLPALMELLTIAMEEAGDALELEKLEELQQFLAEPRDIVRFAQIVGSVASTKKQPVVLELAYQARKLPAYNAGLIDRCYRHAEHLTAIQEGRNRPNFHDAFKQDTLPLVVEMIKRAQTSQRTSSEDAKNLERLLQFLAGTTDGVRYARIVTALSRPNTAFRVQLLEQAHKLKEERRRYWLRRASSSGAQDAGIQNRRGLVTGKRMRR
jgi:hypothetical protein